MVLHEMLSVCRADQPLALFFHLRMGSSSCLSCASLLCEDLMYYVTCVHLLQYFLSFKFIFNFFSLYTYVVCLYMYICSPVWGAHVCDGQKLTYVSFLKAFCFLYQGRVSQLT